MFWPELLGQALEPDQTARAKTWRKCPGLERVQSAFRALHYRNHV